jgi:hypothetical protein
MCPRRCYVEVPCLGEVYLILNSPQSIVNTYLIGSVCTYNHLIFAMVENTGDEVFGPGLIKPF